jgi:LmbE family N-acetylglucosaminyl deacetylase
MPILLATALLLAHTVPTAPAPAAVAPLDIHIGPATRLLVLSAHPDDETLGAAGLIRRVVTSGGKVRVLLMTSGDGFPQGVQLEDKIAHPTAADYRSYAALRERETLAAMSGLGVAPQQVTFLGFPDEGLCELASKYVSARVHAYESPYTDRVSPPATERVIRDVQYRGVDVRREIEQVVRSFAPTIVLLPHPGDEHPDHCSTHLFGREAFADLAQHGQLPHFRILHYLIHYRQWPVSADAGTGADLRPPAGFPQSQGQWRALRLNAAETDAKRRAIAAYASQMLVLGHFMPAFGRNTELFLEGEPASSPKCWCNGVNIATEVPTAKARRRPPRHS